MLSKLFVGYVFVWVPNGALLVLLKILETKFIFSP